MRFFKYISHSPDYISRSIYLSLHQTSTLRLRRPRTVPLQPVTTLPNLQPALVRPELLRMLLPLWPG